MQIYIFTNINKEMKFRGKFVSPSKYNNEYYTSSVLYIFGYYVHSVHFWIFKFSINE